MVKTLFRENNLGCRLAVSEAIQWFFENKLEGIILESNDWDKNRPKVILVEIIDSSLNSLMNESIYQFLVSKGYSLFAKLVYTCIFKIEANLTE